MLLLGLLLSTLLAVSDGRKKFKKNNTKPRPIIIDTDIFGDVDDIGALAIANVLHNQGLADLKGVTINTHSKYGTLATSAINTYFGNGQIPIAGLRPFTDEIWTDTHFFTRSDYASKVAMNFPRELQDVNETKTPLELYLEFLESAEDDSLVIISIGFLNNLAALLNSSSSSSLITKKVHELVVMGGKYPGPGLEFNFGHQDPAATAQVLQQWPRSVPITYIGFELGLNILSGDRLRENSSPDSPVLAAYEWYVGRCSSARESWDPISTLYGILGLDGFDKIGMESPFVYANEHGYNSIIDDRGTNVWVNDTSVMTQRWLKLADGVSNSSVATMLEQFYAQGPGDASNAGLYASRHEEL